VDDLKPLENEHLVVKKGFGGFSRCWLQPQIEVRHHGIQALGSHIEDVVPGVAWGLGWGLEPEPRTFSLGR
jgi:hypothetical protein